MSDNVISLAGFALIGDAGKTMAEMHAEAIGAVELLRCVNLLELTPTQRQTCIKKLAWLKRVAAITSKAFEDKLTTEGRARGKALTEEETLALLAEHDPTCGRISVG